jgi:membrane protein implicated in regulation of membrane protease activity
MPVLPIIDLLILLGWTTLAAGGFLKAIHIATSYRPTLFSLAPIDLFYVALAFLGLALTLAARTWVRLNEPQLLVRRSARVRNGVARGEEAGSGNGEIPVNRDAPQAPPAGWQRLS